MSILSLLIVGFLILSCLLSGKHQQPKVKPITIQTSSLNKSESLRVGHS